MTGAPVVLAFDTAAAHVAATLTAGERVLTTRTEEMGRGQAERLLPMLEEILSSEGFDWSDLAAIGVGTGPGNFTGVRISVAAARGLSMALGIPAVGVTTLEALALGTPGPVIASVDARGERLYLQGFGGAEVPPRLCTLDELPPLPAGATCIGHRAGEIAARAGGHAAAPRHPLTEAIARLALARRDATREPPAPLYIRPADAAPPRDAGPVILPA